MFLERIITNTESSHPQNRLSGKEKNKSTKEEKGGGDDQSDKTKGPSFEPVWHPLESEGIVKSVPCFM